MKKKFVVGASALALLLWAGTAFAQMGNPIGVTSSTTTSVAPGTQNAVVGSFSLSGGQVGTSNLASIPLTLAVMNGAQPTDLTNCQIYNSSAQAISGALNSVQVGNNVFSFSPALSFTGETNNNFTVRCNVASGATTGGLYQFTAGAPVFAPSLLVGFAPLTSASTGSGQTLALITLDASRSGTSVTLPSIPVQATFANGGAPGNLANCTIQNPSAPGVPLNSGANAVSALNNSTSFTFNSAITIPAGDLISLVLVCDVNSATPQGATYTLSATPSSFAATDPSTNNTITAAPEIGLGGNTLTDSGTVTVGTSGTTVPPVTTPGVPNTGAGGEAEQTLLLLGLTIAVMIAGGYYLARTSRS